MTASDMGWTASDGVVATTMDQIWRELDEALSAHRQARAAAHLLRAHQLLTDAATTRTLSRRSRSAIERHLSSSQTAVNTQRLSEAHHYLTLVADLVGGGET